MEHWFDDFSRVVASPLPRRRMLALIAGAIVPGAIGLRPRLAAAQAFCETTPGFCTGITGLVFCCPDDSLGTTSSGGCCECRTTQDCKDRFPLATTDLVCCREFCAGTNTKYCGVGGSLPEPPFAPCWIDACIGRAEAEAGGCGCSTCQGTPSGPSWVPRFPGSTSIEDLVDPFRTGARNFHAALLVAKATAPILATYRPPQRAYLMHWSSLIARKITDPRDVPTFPGPSPAERAVPAYRGPDTVDICWVHKDQSGKDDIGASIAAAEQMVNGYGLGNNPAAYPSRHSLGVAMDMKVSWKGSLKILDANGNLVHIHSQPRSALNTDLQAVAATYGVIHFVPPAKDPNHWSIDGH